ncbi:hypothetical protein [Ovoidimarina sediminis]|uniref:hypothetical protein n=1 Tax=Ovoidimarina sediminis TaxID=3079856 RepID=UPI00290BEA42|nr:hypothetical protein [Rhodophyticola sp. MJ-SS7]MDU8944609.1 hypothetical protein [Rhodophyticola sp. MJ-SS7]
MRQTLLLLATFLAAPATAQTPQDAATANMMLATEICLRHQHQDAALPGALQAAGFTVTPGLDQGSYDIQAPELFGVIAPGYCTFQSQRLPIATAEAIGLAVGEYLFPNGVQPGQPSSQANAPRLPCEGFTVWSTRPVITVSYAQAGNSGECVNDGTSAIIIRLN